MSSYSSLKAYRECAWKRVLNSYFKGIGGNNEALIFGSCYHLALEKGIDIAVQELHTNGLGRQEELLREMYNRIVVFMAKNNIKILEHEVNFEIVLEGNEENPYVGYIDAVVEWNGDIYLAEFKTTRTISLDHVAIDTQLTSYLWACKMLEIYNPKGIIWIANKKAIEKAPIVLKDGSLSVAKNQGVFSGTYELKAREIYGDEIPNKIERFIEWLKQNDSPYIAMVATTRTDEQIEQYGRLVRKFLPEETALLKKLKDDGVLAVRDECYAFPCQQCAQTCNRKEMCFAILKAYNITEDEIESYRDILEEEYSDETHSEL